MKKRRRRSRTDRLVSWGHSPGHDFIWEKTGEIGGPQHAAFANLYVPKVNRSSFWELRL